MKYIRVFCKNLFDIKLAQEGFEQNLMSFSGAFLVSYILKNLCMVKNPVLVLPKMLYYFSNKIFWPLITTM